MPTNREKTLAEFQWQSLYANTPIHQHFKCANTDCSISGFGLKIVQTALVVHAPFHHCVKHRQYLCGGRGLARGRGEVSDFFAEKRKWPGAFPWAGRRFQHPGHHKTPFHEDDCGKSGGDIRMHKQRRSVLPEGNRKAADLHCRGHRWCGIWAVATVNNERMLLKFAKCAKKTTLPFPDVESASVLKSNVVFILSKMNFVQRKWVMRCTKRKNRIICTT